MNIDFKNMSNSKRFKVAVFIIAEILILLVIFQAGIFLGYRKASFYNRIGERYFSEINGRGMMMGIRNDSFSNTHGAIGQIIQIKLPIITVLDRDGLEKAVTISSSTAIKNMNVDIKKEDLKINDYVVIFGSDLDDNSIVDARLIRILPSPLNKSMMNSSSAKTQ